MTQNSSGATKKKSTRAKSTRRAASPAEKQAQKNKSYQEKALSDDPRLFDDRIRRDVAGISCIILGVILFASMIISTDAPITAFVQDFMHHGLGFGAYILPFLLLIIAASFLVRVKKERVSLRISLGIALIFIAFLSLLALFTPESAPDATNRLFVERELVGRGGYLGAGIAWVGLSLFGQVISCIIIVGIALIGFVIVGFSLSGLVERIRCVHTSDKNDVTTAKRRSLYTQRSGRNRQEEGFATNKTEVISDVCPGASFDSDQGHELSPTQVIKKKDSRRRTLDEGSARALTRKLGREDTPDEADFIATHTQHEAKQKSNRALCIPRPDDNFSLPPMSLLKRSKSTKHDAASNLELKQTAAHLQESLESFQIYARVVDWIAGPTVTLFKVDLPAGVRVSRITALEDDVALALSSPGVRIFAPVPGTNYVGIEVPNHTRQNVLLGDVLPDAVAGPLQIAIGKDVEGHCIISDLSKMPHLLIGGTTGSGKSVAINSMIMSILMRATPSEVRFIMIDPKRVEFTPYNGIPHLYVPVVTEPREAASALSWGVAEMERRLKIFSQVGARNIAQYNTKVQTSQLKDDTASEFPYIVIIIDELADLMMNVGKEVEFSISRIAQVARAAGIHLIVATQRPSTNVVTGLIKANITNRIAFNVASGIDSRVILDTPGAENLIGLGDLLLSAPKLAKPQRIQGCYVSEEEISAVVAQLKEHGDPEYHSEILQTNLITLATTSPDASTTSSSTDDPLLWDAADIVVAGGIGSTSSIQRRLKVGYSRAGRIMDMLEEKGVVGPPNGSKPREVLIDATELETLKAFDINDAVKFKE